MNASSDSTRPERADRSEWDRIAGSKRFRDLLALKKAFILPVFTFFFVFYFALPISVGFAPDLMSTRVLGGVTLAYLFALAQFVVAWLIAWIYLRVSAKFDALAKDILETPDDGQGSK